MSEEEGECTCPNCCPDGEVAIYSLPLRHFERFHRHAVEHDPPRAFPGSNNCVLATVDDDGWPSARCVSLYAHSDSKGFEFCTSELSPKGADLAASPVAALTFLWPASSTQARIVGSVVRQDKDAVAAHFEGAAHSSQAYFVATGNGGPFAQSSVLTNVEEWKDHVETVDAQEEPYTLPDHWVSYALIPHTIEFLTLVSPGSRTRYIHLDRCRQSGPAPPLRSALVDLDGDDLTEGTSDVGHGWVEQHLAM